MALNLNIKKSFTGQKWIKVALMIVSVVLFLTIGYSTYLYMQNAVLKKTASKNTATIQQINEELVEIKSQDPYKTNSELKKQINNVQKNICSGSYHLRKLTRLRKSS